MSEPTVLHELRALVGFRLRAGGQDPRRSVVAAGSVVLLLGVLVPLGVAAWAPREPASPLVTLSPSLWFAFLVLTLGTSLASGGGRELMPRQAGVAFPVSAAADQAGALLLTPLNLAWSVQATLVVTITAYTAGPGGAGAAALLAAWVWVLAATTVAQLLGWSAELVRTLPRGAVWLRAAWVLGVAGLTAVVLTQDLGSVLAGLPTLPLYVAALSGGTTTYLLVQLLLVGVGVGALLLTVPVVERLQRRPSPRQADAETRTLRRPTMPSGPLRAAVATDVRSVVRSSPLRRGLLLVLVVPLALAVLLPLPWTAVVVLPALVASGTALLHGVNVVALDGAGAVWRESLPHSPDTTLVGRLLALATLCGAASVVLVLVAAVRAGPPDLAEGVAAATAVVVATAQVVSRCARWSVRHPYPAELRHGRDAPAPPVAMAGYAVRLTAATTLGALLLTTAAVTGGALLVLAVGSVLLSPSLLRLRRTFAEHADQGTRARMVSGVTGG
ncbi:hypothetical protein [Aquipuribacter sp. MA13-6]|uniref:hypothetical protein n=1 Tax=unclassified Aquipuribacter TaxID=2635084 RepID=UPI003EECDA0D